MTPKETTKASIVVGIDTSRESGLALEWAAHEAARQHVPLQILHADSPGYPATGAAAPDAALRGERTDVLASRAERACADAAATARALHPDLDVTISRQPPCRPEVVGKPPTSFSTKRARVARRLRRQALTRTSCPPPFFSQPEQV